MSKREAAVAGSLLRENFSISVAKACHRASPIRAMHPVSLLRAQVRNLSIVVTKQKSSIETPFESAEHGLETKTDQLSADRSAGIATRSKRSAV
jgi:hypothetical protein